MKGSFCAGMTESILSQTKTVPKATKIGERAA